MLGDGSKFFSALHGAVRDKILATVPWPIFEGKNSKILTKMDELAYVEVAKLKKVVDMRTAATRKCSKVQPRALNGEIFMAKKLQIMA